MQILDTNIISYASKGDQKYLVEGEAISSITASEFLEIQSSNPRRANYYVPILSANHRSCLPFSSMLSRRDRPYSKSTTDSVVFSFSADYPSLIEYSNLAISLAINNQDSQLFYSSIRTLSKEKHKVIKGRFDFILRHHISCIPLNQDIISNAHELLSKFKQSHNLKDNFRNSWNDVMILSTAMVSSTTLVTKDTELNRFAASAYPCKCKTDGDTVILDFSIGEKREAVSKQDSKGYINRGWAASFRKYGNVTP
jgi:predicted nucleic acid-binding protein